MHPRVYRFNILKERGKIMLDASISIDRRSMPDRRISNRRTLKDSSLFVEDRKVEQTNQATPFSAACDLLCLMGVAAFSLFVYTAIGFLNGVTSPVGHVILGGGMFIYFLIMFKSGLCKGILGFRYFWQKSS